MRGSRLTGWPSLVRRVSGPAGEAAGTIASRPRARGSRTSEKVSRPALVATFEKDEPLRPSSQSSSCSADTTGTPRSCAAATMSLAATWSPLSECMFTVKAP